MLSGDVTIGRATAKRERARKPYVTLATTKYAYEIKCNIRNISTDKHHAAKKNK